MDLSLNLSGIVAQQLIPSVDDNSRLACLEVLLGTPLVSDLIRKGQVDKLKDLMRKSTELGMQTFDHALYDLYIKGKISYFLFCILCLFLIFNKLDCWHFHRLSEKII